MLNYEDLNKKFAIILETIDWNKEVMKEQLLELKEKYEIQLKSIDNIIKINPIDNRYFNGAKAVIEDVLIDLNEILSDN